MFTKIKHNYKNYLSFKEKNKVTPLSKISIFLLFILDIFVFASLNLGMNFQTEVINNPYTKYSYECRDLVKNPTEVQDYRSDIYLSHSNRNNYYNKYENIKATELDARCKKINTYLKEISEDKLILDIVQKIKQNKGILNEIEERLSYIRDNYNTALFEKIANQQGSILEIDLNTKNAKVKYDKLKKEQEVTDNILQTHLQMFKENKRVNELYNYVTTTKEIITDYESEKKFYYIKQSVISVLFLLPLLLFFAYRMKVNNNRNNYNRYIITKNLFIVTLIPFTIESMRMVWSLIPHTFFQKLIELLYSLNIPFVAYYILIALFVVILTFVIIKVQNRVNLAKKDKKNPLYVIKSFNKNKCIYCSNKVDYITMNYCSYCGNQLKETCISCNQLTFKGLNYCVSCGEASTEE
ncbi:zinc ribbon domain-containing protein [Phocoenobacter skyensis]|uniref:Zinc ribbon domain-containing protein n=1 Tax=Phocoenobacter skyensis TaxID=97481 RepID=A0A1H7V1E0_9PAST|nr:zinc ribbon domain-containing protein [Pasteurella skyensis]MDP8078483.1 zinc ribbon domain-containing protein [Pasteurella skyensis]MDP8084425.1 zinc ribbon domain-containing protein [Pasteurella skyensis]MDP8184756.1 zinc ribbon domain-containing protein [Pasteurella skyensis]QLB23226.1 hypothetical protein A6B44_08430 [Pasteurella skyensis]SEM02980.1 hypothetical protein SAMN05444853_103115 [Pasteurella skyensis]